jgi:hypothetical protein
MTQSRALKNIQNITGSRNDPLIQCYGVILCTSKTRPKSPPAKGLDSESLTEKHNEINT